jgi:hypothetical protein
MPDFSFVKISSCVVGEFVADICFVHFIAVVSCTTPNSGESEESCTTP